MVGWHQQLNGHKFVQTLGNGEGQGSLACCSPWGRKELDTSEQLNNNNNSWNILKVLNLYIIIYIYMYANLKDVYDRN